jgi:uncharacterized protein YndB with AHSA1/START domain
MPDIKNAISIGGTADQVYKAVSTYKGVAGWWTKQCTISPDVGGTCHFAFDAPDGRMEVDADIAALDEDRRVSWTITQNSKHPSWIGTSVTFDITPEGEGTRLAFDHSGFAGAPEFLPQYDQGWQMFLGSIKSYVETGQGKSPY